MKTELSIDNEYEVINGRKIVKKHVAVIHCSSKLSLRERCISNALLYNAYPNLKTQTTFEITLEQLKRLLNITTRNHQPIKEALKSLMSTVIEWNILGDHVPEMDLEGWNATTLLSWVGVSKGVIKYRYDESIKTLFIDPAIYGKINLIIQSRFKSSYALALYENCVRYRGLKYTKNVEFSVFRKLMGVEEGKYDIFRDFNRRVLSPAITEINTCSDIFITPKITRKGKKVHSIMFELNERSIKKRLGVKQNIHAEENSDGDAIASSKLGLSQSNFDELIQKYGESRVEQGVAYVESIYHQQTDQIKNVGAYLRNAIEKNYAITKSDGNSANLKKKKKITYEQEQQYTDYVTNQIMKFYDAMSADKKNDILSQFEAHIFSSGNLPDAVTASVYKKHGIKSVSSDFADFFKKNRQQDSVDIKTIHEFLSYLALEIA